MLDHNLKGEGAAVAHAPHPSATEPTGSFVITYRTLLERHLSGVARSSAQATKLRVNKFKPKRGYRRRAGHRQQLTRIRVTKISA